VGRGGEVVGSPTGYKHETACSVKSDLVFVGVGWLVRRRHVEEWVA